jgi:hypothetical protein
VGTFDDWVRKGILPRPIPGTRRWSRTAIERALSGEVVADSLHLLNWPALIFLMHNGHKLLLREGRTDLPLFGIPLISYQAIKRSLR